MTDEWMEFTVGTLCGLCGNTGRIGRVETISPAGVRVVMEAGRYCICPNGRMMKRKHPCPHAHINWHSGTDYASPRCIDCGKLLPGEA